MNDSQEDSPMNESTDGQHPNCACSHPWADHQQPTDLAGDCDLCDCPSYTPPSGQDFGVHVDEA